jgi:DNA processing protein
MVLAAGAVRAEGLAAARVAEEATKPIPHLHDASFWQFLLAAEASPAKSRDLVRDLGSSSLGYQSVFLSSPDLGPSERKRVGLADLKPLEKAMEDGVAVLTEDEYPETLQQAAAFVSPGLFIKGDASCLRRPTVGIVGTRNASPYGRACAQKFAEALAAQGVTIVSGGALGIDAAAHRGGLAVDGSTAAVLAGGIDSVYPPAHDVLFRELQRKGCLVSQFAVGFRPADYKFLARNVTIAALSQVLIVIQAPTRSGALTTANASAELGREVFVVPANIDCQDFRGSFNLIRDGATLAYHPDQILETLGVRRTPAAEKPILSGPADLIVSVLGMEPLDTDKIATRTGLGAGEVLSELTMLELDGIVHRETTGYILRSNS